MIHFRSVVKSFGGLRVLEEISFDHYPGQVLCLLGPSGSGKTTILNLLGGAIYPDGGEIRLPADLAISTVFQEDRLIPWKTVLGNIAFPLRGQVPPGEIKKLALEQIEWLGLEGSAHRYPHTLSGGMRQRVALARAMAFPHQLLLLDEPFNSLDTPLRYRLLGDLARVQEGSSRSILMVTHAVDEALLLADEILILSQKPTQVRDRVTLSIPRTQRQLTDPRLVELQGRILQVLSG